MHELSYDGGRDRRAVEPRLADDHETTWRGSSLRQGRSKCWRKRRRPLAPEAAWAYRRPRKILHPQHVVRFGDRAEAWRTNCSGSASGTDFNHEAFEFVVIVLGLVIVMRLARVDIVLGGGFQTEQNSGSTRPSLVDDILTPGGRMSGNMLSRLRSSPPRTAGRSC